MAVKMDMKGIEEKGWAPAQIQPRLALAHFSAVGRLRDLYEIQKS